MRLIALALIATAISGQAYAADINKRLTAEFDPVAPSSAVYEEMANGVATSKWGALVDFNLGGIVSTGPEFWTGTFAVKGPTDGETTYRREDLWPGERQKLDAIRLRWTIAKWEQPASMRGWFLKAGYAYTRVNSRANRYTETAGVGDAVPTNQKLTSPDDETDLITDLRHSIVAGFGNRWMFMDNHVTVNLGLTGQALLKRVVTVDSKDPQARADYEDMIETLPDAKMSIRPTPEADLGVGYSW